MYTVTHWIALQGATLQGITALLCITGDLPASICYSAVQCVAVSQATAGFTVSFILVSTTQVPALAQVRYTQVTYPGPGTGNFSWSRSTVLAPVYSTQVTYPGPGEWEINSGPGKLKFTVYKAFALGSLFKASASRRVWHILHQSFFFLLLCPWKHIFNQTLKGRTNTTQPGPINRTEGRNRNKSVDYICFVTAWLCCMTLSAEN